jgi:hypothetical protein
MIVFKLFIKTFSSVVLNFNNLSSKSICTQSEILSSTNKIDIESLIFSEKIDFGILILRDLRPSLYSKKPKYKLFNSSLFKLLLLKFLNI